MVKTEAFLYSSSILHSCTLQSSLQILYHCPLLLQHSCKLLYVPENILHGTKFFPSLLDTLKLPSPFMMYHPFPDPSSLSWVLHVWFMVIFNCTYQYWHHQYCSAVISTCSHYCSHYIPEESYHFSLYKALFIFLSPTIISFP